MSFKVFPLLAILWSLIAAVEVLLVDKFEYAVISALIAIVMAIISTTED